MGRTRTLVGGAAGFALVAGVLGVAGPAHATFAGGEGLLAFVHGGDIYTSTVAGSRHRLTTTGTATDPVWSADGKRIAYLNGGRLWIMNADGSKQHRVSKLSGAGRPAWSPNGRFLAVTANDAEDSGYAGTLYRVTVKNGSTTTFSSSTNQGDPIAVYPKASAVSWSGDGREIVSESTTCQYAGLFENCIGTLTLPAQNATNGTESFDHGWGGQPPYGRAFYPSWLPDSSGYVYTELTCPAEYTCDPPKVVLPDGTKITNASLGVPSPSGRHVAYVRNDSHPNILVSDMNGDNEQRAAVDATDPDWQPTP